MWDNRIHQLVRGNVRIPSAFPMQRVVIEKHANENAKTGAVLWIVGPVEHLDKLPLFILDTTDDTVFQAEIVPPGC